MRKLPLTIASLAVLAGTIATAGAASASTNPVSQDISAQVVISDYLTASFSATSVDFGVTTPGTRASVPHAVIVTAQTSKQHGATLSLLSQNDGFWANQGGPTIIPDAALTVTNSAGQEVHAAGQPVAVAFLDNINPGAQRVFDQTWALDVPSGISGTDGQALHAGFGLSVVANA